MIKLFTCIALFHFTVGLTTDKSKCIQITTKYGLANILLNKTLTNTCLRVLVDQILTEQIVHNNVHNLTIIGLNGITVTCKKNVGVSFENSSRISFSNLKFDGCGGKFESTASPPSGSLIIPYISTLC